MRFPQEIVVGRFLPTYRALLAQALSEHDLPQKRIADLVGVTQAQVSKYLAGKTPLEPSIAKDPRVTATVEDVATGLAQGTLDPVDALGESLHLVGRLEAQGPLHRLLVDEMPALDGTGFDATLDPESTAMQEHRVLTRLRLALRRLEAIGGLAAWVPHVGSNLAEARPGAETLWDVAALPGRIDAVGDSVRVPTDPTFGASRHVATVVLAVLHVDPEQRAALNIAYRDQLHQLAEAAAMTTLAFEPNYEARSQDVGRRLHDHLDQHGALPDLLYHPGAFGIEPVAYLLGPDAPAVVDRLQGLLGGPQATLEP